jgi:hypothetical protein
LVAINPLNAELNPICYLLALLGAHHFLHVSRIRVKPRVCFLSHSMCIFVCENDSDEGRRGLEIPVIFSEVIRFAYTGTRLLIGGTPPRRNYWRSYSQISPQASRILPPVTGMEYLPL